uniref:RPOL9 domain-containing protein n=1 Tax=Steinernema glaseri TaxID=37863 RepID=A0A1I8AWG1_9BILA
MSQSNIIVQCEDCDEFFDCVKLKKRMVDKPFYCLGCKETRKKTGEAKKAKKKPEEAEETEEAKQPEEEEEPEEQGGKKRKVGEVDEDADFRMFEPLPETSAEYVAQLKRMAARILRQLGYHFLLPALEEVDVSEDFAWDDE